MRSIDRVTNRNLLAIEFACFLEAVPDFIPRRKVILSQNKTVVPPTPVSLLLRQSATRILKLVAH